MSQYHWIPIPTATPASPRNCLRQWSAACFISFAAHAPTFSFSGLPVGETFRNADMKASSADAAEVASVFDKQLDTMGSEVAHDLALTLKQGGNVLLLDEPFTGLDRDLHDAIERRRARLVPGWHNQLFGLLARVFPTAADRIMARLFLPSWTDEARAPGAPTPSVGLAD